MKTHLSFASILLLSLLSITCHADEQSWWKSFGSVKVGDFRGGYQPDGEKPASKELEAFLQQMEFKEWETHEDDLVKISYPKHPLLKLELHGGKDGISVEGGVCTTVDNSYQKAYVLRAGDFTYGVFLVTPADWLDDGICLCGPMVHHVYQIKEGCLTRFSLLPSGAVKKAQKLGGKLRLMAFEWTHLACPREIYEQLVERMTLKIKHPKSETELRREVVNRYGLDGMAGFLTPGTSRSAAEALFQSKPKEEKGTFQWTGFVGDYPCMVKTVFVKDAFVKMIAPVNRTGQPAIKGTLSWISDRLEDAGGRGSAEENVLDLTKPQREKPKKKTEFTAEEKEEMVLALIAAAGKSPDRWWESLNLMKDMGSKWKTPANRFTDLILKHGNGDTDELELLSEAKHKGLTEWVEEHLKREMKGEKRPAGNSSFGMGTDGSERAQAYLGYLIREAPERARPAADSLWATGERAFAMAVVKNLPGLEAKSAEDFAKKALSKAIEKSDPEFLEALMEAMPNLKLSDPNEFLKVIDGFNYPKRDGVYLPENYWENRKNELRKAIGK